MYKQKNKCIIADIDGTAYEDFYKDDYEIIKELFGNNRLYFLVRFLDYIARKTNKCAIIPININILRIRLFIYLLITLNFKKGELKEYLDYYYKKYVENFDLFLKNKFKIRLELIKSHKIRLILVTKNPMLINYSYKELEIVISNNKEELYSTISKEYEVLAVIGDNIIDDILPARNLKLPSVLITTNWLAKNIMIADSHCSTFLQAIGILIK